MAGGILVVAEEKNGKLRKSGLEAVSAARGLADQHSTDVVALLIGGAPEGAAQTLAQAGADTVLVGQADGLDGYSTEGYTRAIVQAAKEQESHLVLLSATGLGRDVAPRVAAALDAGMASDCTGMSIVDDHLELVRPVFAGKAYVTLRLDTPVKVVTLRPNVFSVGEPDAGRSAEATEFAVGLEETDLRAKLVEVVKSQSEKPDLTEADIIVSGGRGMKGPEHWSVIEALADELGAVLGASRAVVDSGWRPHSEQVGQTGKTVQPSLYFAIGISGAIQHLAGMRTSKCIVAINKDPEAPIFKVADFGIVGDLFDVVPALTEEVRKLKAE